MPVNVDYGRLARLRAMYRSEYGVDPPASVVEQWTAQQTASAFEPHLREARGAAEMEEARSSLAIGKGRVALGGEELELQRRRYDLEQEQREAEQSAATIGLVGAGISSLPALHWLAEKTGLLNAGGAAAGAVAKPASVMSGVGPTTNLPQYTGLMEPLSAEALMAKPPTEAAGLTAGGALSSAGYAGLGAIGGGLLGRAIGGKTGEDIGSIGGGIGAGALAGTAAGGVGAPVGAIIGGIIGALKSFF